MRASPAIVWTSVEFFRLWQQLCERGQTIWHAKKLPEDLAKVYFHVEFVCPFCPSSGYRDGILSNRAIFVFTSSDLRCHREFSPHDDISMVTRSYLIALWWVPTADQTNATRPDQAILSWSGSVGMGERGRSTLIGVGLPWSVAIWLPTQQFLACQKISCRELENYVVRYFVQWPGGGGGLGRLFCCFL